MRKPKQACPLRLREYEAAIAALKEQRPWLAGRSSNLRQGI